MRMRFPKYDYDDMVEAQYRMLTEGLGIRHMRLIMGTSMGCMHSFVWGETHPDFMSALMPLACEPMTGRVQPKTCCSSPVQRLCCTRRNIRRG
jgi:homoserine O-acetyltransferase